MVDSLDTGYGELMDSSMSNYSDQGAVSASAPSSAPPAAAPSAAAPPVAKSDSGAKTQKQSLGTDLKNTGNSVAAALSAPGPAPFQVSMPQSSGPPQLGGAPPAMMQTHPNLVYSDINLKTNIKPTSLPDINEFVKSLPGPSSFDYKDKQNGSHTEGGLMAQDLLKSKIGASTVVKTNKGLAVDVNKLTPIMTSVLTHKIKMLESKIENALMTRFKGKK